MSPLVLVLKVVVVAIFLVMFLRGNKLFWGIGLLTVTSAILLDTILGTFGRDQMQEELGFFYWVISGALFAGAAIWLWGVLRPIVTAGQGSPPPAATRSDRRPVEPLAWANPSPETTDTVYDRQMLYEQIRYRFSPDDVLDLLFDLGLNENDVVGLHQSTNELIVNIIDAAEQQGQTGNLALAVERILTPVTPAKLPRLSKISVDSPPTILRHSLLAHYSVSEIEQMAAELDVDWENIAGLSKKAKVRNLLLYLYRRNRIGELVELMQAWNQAADEEE
ncbi:MAG: hypothetical protein ACWGPS_05910 [Candidatus Promineifilaceae bacterium]